MAMLYHHQVEFAVGHGVSVRAETTAENPRRAYEIATSFVPAYEVAKTTPPTQEEIPQLTGLVLDMQQLAQGEAQELTNYLNPLVTAYSSWIEQQQQRINDPAEELTEYQDVAESAIANCQQTLERIQSGIAVLQDNPQAVAAFGFMNHAMWQQRIHSLYAEKIRRGEKLKLADIDIPKNRSWYPFQLAFILLNLPSVTDLHHQDRSDPTKAIADLPNLAVMVMGLEEWEKNRTAELSELRLLVAVRRRLGSQVKELRLPPMPSETAESPLDEAARIGIPVAPFPSWMVCPKCRLLAPLQSGLFELKHNPYRPNEARYVHTHCPRTKKPPAVIPARFLVACENGHLDDFPWRYFVHQGNSDCKGSLRLEEYGVSGAATDIVVNCNGCKSSRRLSDAFGEVGKNNLPACRGRHPHLRNFEDCDRQMKSILLGASNSWFSSTLSALSIPSAANQLEELVEQNWVTIGKANSQETLQVLLSALQATGQLQDFTSYPLEEIWATVAAKQQGIEETETDYQDLKTPEWQIFSE